VVIEGRMLSPPHRMKDLGNEDVLEDGAYENRRLALEKKIFHEQNEKIIINYSFLTYTNPKP